MRTSAHRDPSHVFSDGPSQKPVVDRRSLQMMALGFPSTLTDEAISVVIFIGGVLESSSRYFATALLNTHNSQTAPGPRRYESPSSAQSVKTAGVRWRDHGAVRFEWSARLVVENTSRCFAMSKRNLLVQELPS